MAHFPAAIDLPSSVLAKRKRRLYEVSRAARLSLLTHFLVVLIEGIGAWLSHSHTLMIDTIATLIDLFSTLLLLLFLKLAARPPDATHPFGHGRFEPLIGLQLALLMAISGAVLCFKQINEIHSGQEHLLQIAWFWLLPLAAAIFLSASGLWLKRVAAKEFSLALQAEANHLHFDGLTNFVAALALFMAQLFPRSSLLLDQYGAAFIALSMIVSGCISAIHNVNQLLDRAPSKFFFERVRQAALKVSGVFDTEKIRIQLYGPDAHVDIDIEVDPALTVDEAHRISQRVRVEIQKEWPAVHDVTVHIEPYYPGDH